jgi:hypothetical protein
MSITYNYEIVKVDEASRVMEVVYSSSGRQTMHVSARLPYEGESLEDIIRMYSPVSYWIEKEMRVVCPVVGASGVLTS